MMHLERISVDQYIYNSELCLLIFALRYSLLISVAQNRIHGWRNPKIFEMKWINGLFFKKKKVEIDVLVLLMFFSNTNFRDPFNLIMCVCFYSPLSKCI